MMEVLGITGGIGSGKSMVLDLLSQRYGYQVLRTDEIAKELMDSEGPAGRLFLRPLAEGSFRKKGASTGLPTEG